MHLRPFSSGVLAAALAAGTVVGVPAIANAAPATADDIVINEIESNGDPAGDWIELANRDTDNELDISGWTLIDDDPTHEPIVFPEGATIESGGYLVQITDQDPDYFGLGGDDTVTLRDAAGTIVDSTTWDGHSPASWGRIPDMTGDFAVTGESTRGGANITASDVDPVETEPWPHDPLTIEPVDLGADFADEDMSGVDFAADGTAYVVNNGTGTLYVLAHDPATGAYTVAQTLVLKYSDGAGLPDAEGVTVGHDGAIYVATERNNDDGGTSRPSVLRYAMPDSGDATINATDEYSLAEITGELGSNGGLETVEYIPDAWGGVYAVGVEQTGDLHFVQFGDDGEVTLMQTAASGFQGVMALDHEEATGVLRVVCDEVCEGRSIEMTFDGEQFVTDGTLYARPAALDNRAYEGYAAITETVECEAGGTAERSRFLWADDAASKAFGLRGAVAEADCSSELLGGSLETGSLGGAFGAGSLALVLQAGR